MQSPFTAIMGIADGDSRFLHGISNDGKPRAGFEEQLNSVLAGGERTDTLQPQKAPSVKDDPDEESVKDPAASPQAETLLNFLSALNALGLSSQDARALLTGNAEGVSDEALQAILHTLGIRDAAIDAIMADQAQVTGLKASLAEAVSSKVLQQTTGGIQLDKVDVDRIIELSTSDQAAFDAATAKVSADSRGLRLVQEIPQESLQPNTNPVEISQAASEINKIIMISLRQPGSAALKNTDASFTMAVQASDAETGSGMSPEFAEALSTLEKTFQIPKQTVRALFLETDQATRLNAVDEVAAQITAYLKDNAGKELPKQFANALSLLKGALSSDEFARIEGASKLLNPDINIAAQPFSLTRAILAELGRSLGDKTTTLQGRYTDSVMDQIRLVLPAQAKAGGGSMTIELHPPMLGRVDVDIRLEDGRIMAAFKADQPITRDILQQNMHILKEALAEQGIKAAQFVVTADTFNSRHHDTPFAWMGYEQGGSGSSRRQGREQDTGGTFKGHDEYVQNHTQVKRYSEQDGLDFFA